MKYAFILFSIALLSGCSGSSNKSKEAVMNELEHIAWASGIDSFGKVKELHFTFNVKRGKNRFSRSWIWNRELNTVTMHEGSDTITYNLNNIPEEVQETDHKFINDKYWLLFPFQLVWDTNFTYTNHGLQKAPISGKKYLKITIQYGDAGYTPGDAYDIYVDGNWLIREWVFRKSGQEEASLATTWEGYSDYNGIKISTVHNNKPEKFRIYFSDIRVK